MTVQHVELMTTDEARRITVRIRTALDRVASGWADLAERIGEAYERRADLALGYDSWQSYAAAELKPSEGIAAEVRRELVGLLSARGMSTRAIAPTVGVSNKTISLDVREVLPEVTPAERIDYATGEVVTDQRGGTEPPASFPVEAQPDRPPADPAPRPAVTGLDGKTYSRTDAPTPRRRSIVDAAQEAAAEVLRAVEKVERVFADDRYPKNREQVAEVTNGYLSRSAELLGQLINSGKE